MSGSSVSKRSQLEAMREALLVCRRYLLEEANGETSEGDYYEALNATEVAPNPAISHDGAENNTAASRLAGASASRSAPPSPRARGVLSPPLREDCDPTMRPSDD